MGGINEFISCPQDCPVDSNIPVLPADANCDTLPESSEVQFIWFVPDGAPNPFTGWDDATPATITATADSVDNTVTDNSKSKMFRVIGEVPVPDKVTKIGIGFKERITRRTYNMNLNFPSLAEDEIRAFLQWAQCGITDGYTMYYGTEKRVYGSSTGIKLSKIDADLPLETGEDSDEMGTLILQFKATTDPNRMLNNPYN